MKLKQLMIKLKPILRQMILTTDPLSKHSELPNKKTKKLQDYMLER